MGPARQALRDATRAIHDRLDAHPVLQPLARPTLTLDQYRAALVALHGFHAPVEARIGVAGRLDLLRADLADLGVDAAALPVAGAVPDLASGPARLAARYVLDGSAHGGRSMLAGVTRALGVDGARGARFLASTGVDVAGDWTALLARLETELAALEARAEACAAAVALFEALERWLDQAPRAL